MVMGGSSSNGSSTANISVRAARLLINSGMEWTDDGIVLAVRRHGDSGVIASLLTREHGRHAGLVRGGRRNRGILQTGNRVHAAWRARLEEHLGSYGCELLRSFSADFLDDPPRLAALSAACAMAESALPERQPHARVHAGLLVLLESLGEDTWPTIYVKWELGLLRELGFGLDLSRCAATGRADGLAYVSPRTGRAVSLAAGAPYKDRLLTLPPFLLRVGVIGDPAQVCDGLRLAGYFLEHCVFAAQDRTLPPARQRLEDRLREAIPTN